MGVANRYGRIREIIITNTTNVEFSVGIARASAAGTVGAGLTEVATDQPAGYSPAITAFNTHTADATLGSIFRRAMIGAAIGAGVHWTWGENGLFVPDSTAIGYVLVLPTGTAQHFDYTFVWDE